MIASLLEEANVFKINDEELDLIREMFSLSEDEDTACRQLVERYSLRYMILTAGSRYSSVYTVADKSTILTPKSRWLIRSGREILSLEHSFILY